MENHWDLATEETLICDTPDCPALQELRYQQARERKRRLASSIVEEVLWVPQCWTESGGSEGKRVQEVLARPRENGGVHVQIDDRRCRLEREEDR